MFYINGLDNKNYLHEAFYIFQSQQEVIETILEKRIYPKETTSFAIFQIELLENSINFNELDEFYIVKNSG